VGETVLVTDDWVAFKREAALYLERARVFYSIVEQQDAAVVKIVVGKIGFEREFDLKRDEDKRLFNEVKNWLNQAEGYPVKRAVPDDIFFSEVGPA